MKVIHADGPVEIHKCPSDYGLFNRVLAMLQLLAEHSGDEMLNVECTPSMHCPGVLSEVFAELPGVKLHDTTQQVKQDTGYKLPLEIRQHTQWKHLVKHLQVSDHITQRVYQLHDSCNSQYVAVHVRRTDMDDKRLAEESVIATDQNFVDWIDQQIDHNPGVRLYIATDNQVTHDKFKKLYHTRVLNPQYHDKLKLSSTRATRWKDSDKHKKRHTTLTDAVLDWCMCVGAAEFRGTSYSTFTAVAQAARNMKTSEKPGE